MASFIVRRLIAAMMVTLVVSICVFALVRFAPGDPAMNALGNYASQQKVEEFREELGLNDTAVVQYLRWLGNLLQGDMGRSIFSDRPVTELFSQRIEPTLLMSLFILILSSAVAIPAGVAAAWYRGRVIDKVILFTATLGFSMPVFVIGYILIWVLAVKLHLLPTSGYVSIFVDPIGSVRSLIMPVLTVSLVFMAIIARITRTSMIEVLKSDFVRTARAKGLSSRAVLYNHALRNGSIPIVTTIGGTIAIMIGGVVITESVYAIPGMGRLVMDAILRRDYPVVQGVILVFSAVYVLINLLIDISYACLDPRIRN